MQLSIDHKIKDDFRVFRVSGDMSMDEAKKLWIKIYSAIINDKPKGIILLDSSSKLMRYYETIDIVDWFILANFPKDLKIAIIDPNPLEGVNRFIQDVATVKGWYNIRVLQNEIIALDWLAKPIV
jgi:hypothetical protein